MNTIRDKFLTIAMLECWHDSSDYFNGTHYCSECGKKFDTTFQSNNNFSSWNGFGKLYTFARKQDWWSKFKRKRCHLEVFEDLDEYHINPDRFADSLFYFLKEKWNE